MLLDVEGLSMKDALIGVSFLMILLGPVVLAALVDLNSSVPE